MIVLLTQDGARKYPVLTNKKVDYLDEALASYLFENGENFTFDFPKAMELISNLKKTEEKVEFVNGFLEKGCKVTDIILGELLYNQVDGARYSFKKWCEANGLEYDGDIFVDIDRGEYKEGGV